MTNWKEVKVSSDNNPIWDREEPIEGRFVKVEENIGPNNSKMYTLETNEGEVNLWGSYVLDDKLMSVPQGTLVKIIYKGKSKGKKGNSYHDFSVYFDEDGTPEVGHEEEPGIEQARRVAKALRGEVVTPSNADDDDGPLEVPPEFLN